MSQNPGERTAPWYPVPSQDIVCVEHPCIVKNVDKAIDTLQGYAGISEVSQACLTSLFYTR